MMRINLGLTRPRYSKSHAAESLTQAWAALVHPATWVCMVVLLLNDQVLRWRWPSWWTGKLGDVAWLAFAPLVVALGLAAFRSAVLPCANRKGAERRDATIFISMIGVGTVFAVIKAVPAATQAFHSGFRAVFGWQPLLVRDPTDLLTLPALGIAWMIWRHSVGEKRQPAYALPIAQSRQRPRFTTWGWAGLALALLATLGNSGPPDVGIVCVEKVDDRLLAGPHYSYAYTETFESTDGGLTWIESSLELADGAEPACRIQEKPWTIALPEDDVVYQIHPSSRIRRSSDGGTTWTTELALPGSEARIAYVQSLRSSADGGAGPHNAVFDAASGNLLLTMGLEGMLVRRDAARPDAGTGMWHWVPVGDYRYERLTAIEAMTGLLGLEVFLALSAMLVSIAFSSWRFFRWPMRSVTVVWALGIVGTLLILRPALMTGYATTVGLFASVGLAIGSVILAFVSGVRIWQHSVSRRSRELLRVIAVGVVTAVLFLLPLAFWAVGLLPYYAIAMWISAVLLAVSWGYAVSRTSNVSGKEDSG